MTADQDTRLLLAAIAAALLGAQGSTVWARTAESLLRRVDGVDWHYRTAVQAVDRLLEGSD